MILGQISFLDCLVFLISLAPQLIIQVGLWVTLRCGIQALPFLVLALPYQFIKERFFTRQRLRSPFVRQATWFQDVIIRCVRYAFADIPASIGRVFFSKEVALPFLNFRLLRHGYIRSSVYWREVEKNGFHGIWITIDELEQPDIIVYYCHGGGFSMGSSYFYLEFLLAWVTLLKQAGFRNPALFTLEYSLVPEAVYPTQLHQTIAGYDYVLSIIGDPLKVCVAGDSAGGTLILSLLLYLANLPNLMKRPGHATLISPWVTLVSPENRNTPSDFLDAQSLHLYARQYAGSRVSLDDPLVSPGTCDDLEWWRRAMPSQGMSIFYGSEEVFASEIKRLVRRLQQVGTKVYAREEQNSIHCWPVATMFLSDTKAERQKGLVEITKIIFSRIGGQESKEKELNGYTSVGTGNKW